MKKSFFSLIFSLVITSMYAQDEAQYLAGAVPVIDGKVKFSSTFTNPLLSQEQMFNQLLNWSQKRFKTEEKNFGRVLYSNSEKGQIVNQGSEYIIFAQKALSLDRAKINYRLVFLLSPSKCEMEISNINYIYGEKDEKLLAEEWITDDMALNKSKTKLMYGTKKFRIKTIDLINELENEIKGILSVQTEPELKTSTMTTEQNIFKTPSDENSGMPGYSRIAPEKIPGNIIKLLSQDWMLITAGNGENNNVMTASWGGLGYLYNKPVAFCFINPSRYTYQYMEKGDVYTLSFYTEAHREALKYCGTHSGENHDKIKDTGLTSVKTPSGSTAFSEAWMIIECKKTLSQSIIPEALHDEKLRNEWKGKPMHKMYIGEILNVWIK